MSGVQNILGDSSLGAITHRNMRADMNAFSNADGGMGGMIGGIAQGIGSAVSGVAGAIGQGKAAKQDRLARETEADANVKIAKDNRTAALSTTTQELIKANEEKQKNKQRTQTIMIVVTVLIIAVLGFIVMKDDKTAP